MSLLLFRCHTAFLSLIILCSLCCAEKENADSTGLVRGPDDRPLIFTTLGGGMVALEQNTGNILWTLKDEPVVKVPNDNENRNPQFLPDPRYGSLYMFGTHAGERQILKKLPFTIPQLVANAPCRSSDGILYTGKKIDTWFMIDPKTGIRKQILGDDIVYPFGESRTNTCPLDPKCSIYVARTEYNILMYDSKNQNHKWNVTFFDYSSHSMGKEMSNDYGTVHFTSTSNGRITTFDRKTGHMIWSHDMDSPVVAAYLLDRDGLIAVPFNAVGDGTMDHIIEDVSSLKDGQEFKYSNIELFPSLYIGEHIHGLYALSSLVDKNTITISADVLQPLLLEGPSDLYKSYDPPHRNRDRVPEYKPNVNIHYDVKKIDSEVGSSYLLLGHYTVPEYAEANFRLLSKSALLSLPIQIKRESIENTQLKLIMGPSSETKPNWYEIENSTGFNENELINDEEKKVTKVNEFMNSVASQTEYEKAEDIPWSLKFLLKNIFHWMYHQDILGIKFMMCIGFVIIVMMFLHVINRLKEVQQMSQSGSNGYSHSYIHNGQLIAAQQELEDGTIKVGKIVFNPKQILGKGCDGTFVYRGAFENRDVAVKRLLPDCFSFADREVALLSESDTHVNVVRYYCMEQDKMFRYIALELCSATLQDYVQKKLEIEYNVSCIEVLRQATAGLAHLHSLDIVHRDIKPHNVLLSIPNNKNAVRVMISDFGLCKKLNIGRHSFSRRSGITGTDGWIAPEMLNGERTTTSVDIFSLGCVFYYVLSKGVHPFGDNLERQGNILKGDYNLDKLSLTLQNYEVDLAICLIKEMIISSAHLRPEASTVYEYPLFWNNQKILTFLQDVSDRVEKDPPGGPLETGGLAVVQGDWRLKVDSAIANDLRKYRSYNGDSVRDLLRAMRNKKHHYRELNIEAQISLGAIPDGFTVYWLKRFPTLLLHVWLRMQSVKHEVQLLPYYDERYVFNDKYLIEKYEFSDEKFDYFETIPENDLFIKSKNYVDRTTGKKIKTKRKTTVKPAANADDNTDVQQDLVNLNKNLNKQTQLLNKDINNRDKLGSPKKGKGNKVNFMDQICDDDISPAKLVKAEHIGEQNDAVE